MRIVPQLAAVLTEQTFYLGEFGRLVFDLAPIALTLIAITLLRRKQPTHILHWMQVTAGIWLALALLNRLILAWTRGFTSTDDNSFDRLQVHVRLSKITWNLETLVFPSIAFLLLVDCRRSFASPV